MEVTGIGTLTDIDKPIALAFEANVEGPLRVRVQPEVYMPKEHGSGMYMRWKKVKWACAFANFEEAQQFRCLMQEFFTALALVGPTTLRVHLASLRKPLR